MTQRVVIVGSGLAGLRSAESLRRAGFAGQIVAFGAECHPPYTRPPLTKEAITKGAGPRDLAFDQRALTSDVEWRLGRPVTAVDLRAQSVTLMDGGTMAYDGLILASGLRPRRLATPATGTHVLRTVEDAAGLRARLVAGDSAIVIGSGFVGCEVAASACALGVNVTMVTAENVPLARQLGALLGTELRRRLEEFGVQFILGAQVAGVATGMVMLSDGQSLVADVIIEALGSRTNTEWLAGNGLDLSDGVPADNALRVIDGAGVTIDGVHVVGDLARYPNPLFDDTPRRVEHWSNATDTGRRAGAALAAFLRGDGYVDVTQSRFAPLPSFWSDQGELRLQAYGMPALADTVEMLDGVLEGTAVVGYRRRGDLVAVVSLGMSHRLAKYLPEIGHG